MENVFKFTLDWSVKSNKSTDGPQQKSCRSEIQVDHQWRTFIFKDFFDRLDGVMVS